MIVANYNGKHYLHQSIPMLLGTRYSNFDVIIVDSGSRDGSRKFLKEEYGFNSRVSLIFPDKNDGLGTAQNLAAKASRGEFLAFLDNDAFVTPDWLSNIIREMHSDKCIGVAQSKLLREDCPDLVDGVGAFISPAGLLVERDGLSRGNHRGQWNRVEEIFSAKGASMTVRKSVFCKAGGFDPDFFMYNEEPDLCWRVWDLGYKVMFIPTSIVFHKAGGSITARTSVRRYFHGTKNYIIMISKNMPSRDLLIAIPIQLGVWTLLIGYLVSRRKTQEAMAVLRGLLWPIRHIKLVVRKRLNRKIPRRSTNRNLTRPFNARYLIDAMHKYSRV